MICPYCQTTHKENAKYCNECGKPFSATQQDMVSKESAEVNKVGSNENPDQLDSLGSSEENLTPADLIEIAALELKELATQTESDPAADTLFSALSSGVAAKVAQKPMENERVVKEEADENNAGVVSRVCDADKAVVSEEAFTHESDKTIPLDPTPPAEFAPKQPESVAKNDLTGIDECLVDSSYVPPQNAWRGSTMEMDAVKGDGGAGSKEHKAANPLRSPRAKKTSLIVLGACGVVAVVAILLAWVTYSLEIWGGKIVPNVVGKTQVDAEYLLNEKGFSVDINEVPSDETQGIVLYVTPNSGDRSDGETPVVINVSVPRIIPEVKALPREDALANLEVSGVTNVKVIELRSSETADTILDVSPQAGSVVTADDEILLTVAVPFTVPNVLGLMYEEAEQQMVDAGYTTTLTYDTRESDRNGVVLFTSPAPDTMLDPGSNVTITISQSRGATLIEETEKFLKDLQENNEALFASNGDGYFISSLGDIKFSGNEKTTFIATATTTANPSESVEITGTITWDSLNYIVDINVR